jgi:hypothetical protein
MKWSLNGYEKKASNPPSIYTFWSSPNTKFETDAVGEGQLREKYRKWKGLVRRCMGLEASGS